MRTYLTKKYILRWLYEQMIAHPEWLEEIRNNVHPNDRNKLDKPWQSLKTEFSRRSVF